MPTMTKIDLATIKSKDPCLNGQRVKVFDWHYTSTQALATFEHENVTFLWPRDQLKTVKN